MSKVCVIGAGAAGLSVLRTIPDTFFTKGSTIICYESSSCVGGHWNQYQPKKTPSNNIYATLPHGDEKLPDSSMYRNLITNLPTCVMQYPDYEWKKDELSASFVHRSEVSKYLQSYCDQFQLDQYIRFRTQVTSLSKSQQVSIEDHHKIKAPCKWQVTTTHKDTSLSETQDFDYVFVCTGHFTFPRYIHVKGLESFQGQVIHSKHYDDPLDYKGKTVLIIGNGRSGVDICTEMLPYCKKAFLSSHYDKQYFPQSSKVHEVALVTSYDRDEKAFLLQNGEKISDSIDTVLFCTGFTYDLPFLDYESCGIEYDDSFLSPLYKFTVHTKCPNLFFVGLCQRIPPFPFFYFQSAFCWSIITSKRSLKLPTNLSDTAKCEEKERLRNIEKRHYFNLSTSEEKELLIFFADNAGVDPPPDWLSEVRKRVLELRKEHPIDYKYYTITRTQNGSVLISDARQQ